MADKRLIKENIVEFVPLGTAHKKRARRPAFKAPFKDEVVFQAVCGQADIDKAYKFRSKKLAKRLREEVLRDLLDLDKKP